MSPAATVLSTAAGATLILLALRDGFDALFHPDGRMMLSRALMRGCWRLFHRFAASRPRVFPLAGPIMLLTILSSWALLLVCGWALVIWPHMPSGFHFASEIGDPAAQQGFVDAVYVSVVTLGTVGYGDISPATDLLRILVPLEALVGFGLLTAAVSWLLSVYPALSRRRSLAYEIALLRGAISTEEFPGDARIPGELLSRLVAVERDMVTIPLSYYFAEADERFSLPAVMPWLLECAERNPSAESPVQTRLRARMLRAAIDDFARTTAKRFHGRHSDSTRELLESYARDHMRAAHRSAGAPAARRAAHAASGGRSLRHDAP
jgi:hypothetical protein